MLNSFRQRLQQFNEWTQYISEIIINNKKGEEKYRIININIKLEK